MGEGVKNIGLIEERMNVLERQMSRAADKSYSASQAGKVLVSSHYERLADELGAEIKGMAFCLRMLGFIVKKDENWHIAERVQIHELRVRYEVPEMFGGSPVVNAIVCKFQTVKVWLDKVKDAGYKLVGVDERYRYEDEQMEFDEGWKEISRREVGA